MKENTIRIIVSVFLIVLGTLFLLTNFNVLPWDITSMEVFWAFLFGFIGVIFLSVFFSNRENWWALIPGFTLIGLGFVAGNILPPRWEDLGGAVFLGMIGLSFLIIYLTQREQWWAIIPGGVLVSLAGVVVASSLFSGEAAGGILFIGIALTFLVLYFRPVEGTRMDWAIWPAGITGVMGLFLLAGAIDVMRFIWPLILIAVGGWVLLRGLRAKNM